jgi:hypothetical protein
MCFWFGETQENSEAKLSLVLGSWAWACPSGANHLYRGTLAYLGWFISFETLGSNNVSIIFGVYLVKEN